jgi:hypothetical protein
MATIQKHAWRVKSRSRVAATLPLLVLAACATLPQAEGRHQVNVLTGLPDGTAVTGARCEVKNDKGVWSIVTPGPVQVLTSDSPLQVSCNKDGYQDGSTLVGKPVDGYVLGELGGLGKLVIGGSSASRPAYMTQGVESPKKYYPDSIIVILKRTDVVNPSVNASTPPVSPRHDSTTLNLDDAQKKCSEIGFNKGTENFGLCVMRLMR